MEDRQRRVVDERDALNAKIESLSSFIRENPAFRLLSPTERGLMRRQCAVMRDYRSILDERIKHFEKG